MMKLVEFEDGTFGIRKFWFFGWYFVDLFSKGYSWTQSSEHFPDCKRTREHAENILSNLKPKKLPYKVVK